MPNRFCNTSLLQVQSGWTLGIPSVRGVPGQKDLAGYILMGFPGQMDLAGQIVTGFPGQMDLAGQIATDFLKTHHIFGGQIHLAEWFCSENPSPSGSSADPRKAMGFLKPITIP